MSDVTHADEAQEAVAPSDAEVARLLARTRALNRLHEQPRRWVDRLVETAAIIAGTGFMSWTLDSIGTIGATLGGLAILWVPGLLLRVRRLESRVAVLHELRLLDLEGE
ncbi:MAG: hypothetical protein H6805_02645 [Planctomycetes bacterium]|nr:hypothetical protein [Planctomycetota bacterium]